MHKERVYVACSAHVHTPVVHYLVLPTYCLQGVDSTLRMAQPEHSSGASRFEIVATRAGDESSLDRQRSARRRINGRPAEAAESRRDPVSGA